MSQPTFLFLFLLLLLLLLLFSSLVALFIWLIPNWINKTSYIAGGNWFLSPNLFVCDFHLGRGEVGQSHAICNDNAARLSIILNYWINFDQNAFVLHHSNQRLNPNKWIFPRNILRSIKTVHARNFLQMNSRFENLRNLINSTANFRHHDQATLKTISIPMLWMHQFWRFSRDIRLFARMLPKVLRQPSIGWTCRWCIVPRPRIESNLRSSKSVRLMATGFHWCRMIVSPMKWAGRWLSLRIGTRSEPFALLYSNRIDRTMRRLIAFDILAADLATRYPDPTRAASKRWRFANIRLCRSHRRPSEASQFLQREWNSDLFHRSKCDTISPTSLRRPFRIRTGNWHSPTHAHSELEAWKEQSSYFFHDSKRFASNDFFQKCKLKFFQTYIILYDRNANRLAGNLGRLTFRITFCRISSSKYSCGEYEWTAPSIEMIFSSAPTVSNRRNISDGNSLCWCFMLKLPAIVPVYKLENWFSGHLFSRFEIKIDYSFNSMKPIFDQASNYPYGTWSIFRTIGRKCV